MVLEYVTYNGNMDMFTHTRVKFLAEECGNAGSMTYMKVIGGNMPTSPGY